MERATLGLTVPERDVLAVSAAGGSVPEVAARLGLPREAVRGLLASAITRLGARSKLEAIIIALRRGLIDVPPDPSRRHGPRMQ
jgi:DNA-binding CsgD family transcriptional regulator